MFEIGLVKPPVEVGEIGILRIFPGSVGDRVMNSDDLR